MADNRKRVAPYASASAMSALFDHIRRVQTPERVSSGLLEDYGVPRSQVFPVLSTLKFLDLIEADGATKPSFRSLQTGGVEFQAALLENVQEAYGDLFSKLDVPQDTRDKIKNYFARNYSPATAERATALFLDLCGEAGIQTAAAGESRQRAVSSDAPKRKSRQRPNGLLPPQSLPQDGRVVVEVRLTEDDLSIMSAEDIEAVFTAAGNIEMARARARAKPVTDSMRTQLVDPLGPMDKAKTGA